MGFIYPPSALKILLGKQLDVPLRISYCKALSSSGQALKTAQTSLYCLAYPYCVLIRIKSCEIAINSRGATIVATTISTTVNPLELNITTFFLYRFRFYHNRLI